MCIPLDDCSHESSPDLSRPADSSALRASPFDQANIAPGATPISGKRPKRPRQHRYDSLAVLAYIATYQRSHNQRTPSEQRIQTALGISAPSVVHTIVQRLERAGLLWITRYGRGHPVDLVLTEAGKEAVQGWQAERASGEPS